MTDRAPTGEHLRPVRDDDADSVIALVGGVYAEYPGCVLDLPGVDADLTAPRTSIDAKHGDMWVAEDDRGDVVAMCGWAPAADAEATIELKRLYVAESHRGRGLGRWLAEQVERVALERGASAVELWSDTRFVDAHRLYERLGFRRLPETRELHDPSDTTEYRFRKELR